MASPLTHAIVAATLAAGWHLPWKLGLVGVACALLPDLDAAGYWLGVPYGSFWGHRGFTHSILFALLGSVLFTWWIGRRTSIPVVQALTYCFVAMLSHGVLDAMTDGGLGVAFFSPIDQNRYFFPIRPIHVSSMSLRDLLSAHGVDVLASECVSVWIPCALAMTLLWWFRRRRRPVSSLE
jgi:inner membrane protein